MCVCVLGSLIPSLSVSRPYPEHYVCLYPHMYWVIIGSWKLLQTRSQWLFIWQKHFVWASFKATSWLNLAPLYFSSNAEAWSCSETMLFHQQFIENNKAGISIFTSRMWAQPRHNYLNPLVTRVKKGHIRHNKVRTVLWLDHGYHVFLRLSHDQGWHRVRGFLSHV